MLVNGSDFYCGNSSGSPCQFALKSMIPSAYVHPSTKQCNYSVDLSGYAKTSDLNSLKTSVSSGKSLVAAAVTGKGVSTAADASFQTIANNVNAISTGLGSGIATIMVSGSQTINAGDIVYLGPGITWDDSNYTPDIGSFASGIFVICKYYIFIYGWCAGLQTFVRQEYNMSRNGVYGIRNVKSYSDTSFSFEYTEDNSTYNTTYFRINQTTGSLEYPSSGGVGYEISSSGSGTISQLLTSENDGNSISYIGWNGKLSPAITFSGYYSRYYKYSRYMVVAISNPNAIMLCMPHYNAVFSYIIPFVPDSHGFPCPYYGFKDLNEVPHHWTTSQYDTPFRYFVPYYGVALSSGSPGNKIQVRNCGCMTSNPWG